jgi:hypothetical protein
MMTILLVCSFGGACSEPDVNSNDLSSDSKLMNKNDDVAVYCKRVSIAVKDDQNNIVAEMFFEKPVLVGDNKSIKNINTIFRDEAKKFFYGTGKSPHFQWGYKRFLKDVKDMREFYEDAILVVDPLENSVSTEITYMNNDIISFKESTYWMMGGVNGQYYYGITVDINTGKMLTLKDFVKTDAEYFNNVLHSELSASFLEREIEFSDSEIEELFIENDLAKYEFYYDGSNYNIIFNNDIYYNWGYIVQITASDLQNQKWEQK